jgi:hypothetical protein
VFLGEIMGTLQLDVERANRGCVLLHALLVLFAGHSGIDGAVTGRLFRLLYNLWHEAKDGFLEWILDRRRSLGRDYGLDGWADHDITLVLLLVKLK